MKIQTILDKITDNLLFVPAFQREYVWKREDAKQLIDSLIKDYPTGTMLTWETSNPPEIKGPHKYKEGQGPVKLLLDGQQRITTLFMLIKGEIPPYYTEKDITKNTMGLYVNLDTLELSYYMKTKMENNPLWKNITDLFQRKENCRVRYIVEELSALGTECDREQEYLIEDNIRKIENILNKDFPEQEVPVKASIREAIDIFYKVNASGVTLTEAELALAQISGYWPQIRELLKKKLEELAEKGFVFKLDFMVYLLLGTMYGLGSDMRKLHSSDNLHANDVREGIKEVWEILSAQTIDYVLNLLRSKAYVDHTKEISSVYALVPIISFFYHNRSKTIPEEQLWRIIKWFYYSQVRRRYVSQLPQKLDFDLRIVSKSTKPFEELLGVIEEESRLEIRPEEFIGKGTSHPLFKMMTWYFKSKGATCFTTGLRIHNNMGKRYGLEKDHIFPTSILKKHGYNTSNRIKNLLAQEVTNRAIITAYANRKKSDNSAYDYLNEAKVNSPISLNKQCIPENEELWKIENFEFFLKERRKLLATGINEYLSSLTESPEYDPGALSFEELIQNGESDELEFKSSLRWDYKNSVVNKDLESVIMKAVAAFANSDGGTLLIGVDDDGNILGLEKDMVSLRADLDKFELHLRNLFNHQFGEAFTARELKVSFPVIQGENICCIDINKSDTPLVVNLKTKNGPQEKFYVRSGNSSVEVKLSEINNYFQNRFN